jgi:type IV pilus assembly protein PilM
MSLSEKIQRLVTEPPPDYAFEVSERGLAQCSPRNPGPPKLELLRERALAPSPSAPNVLLPQLYREALERVTQEPGQRRTAALIIPDYAVRMTVLDFEVFPTAEPDRIALLRFRLRKSVPFHIEEASVSYAVQTTEPKHIEVLTVAIARPILEDYERLFVERGFRVGLVTPSLLAAAPLFLEAREGLTLVIKAGGDTVSVMLIQGGLVRLVRSVDLAPGDQTALRESAQREELLALVQQMAAYSEDQIGERIERVLLSGLEESAYFDFLSRELEVKIEPVRSRFGTASEYETGLLGLLEQYAS